MGTGPAGTPAGQVQGPGQAGWGWRFLLQGSGQGGWMGGKAAQELLP